MIRVPFPRTLAAAALIAASAFASGCTSVAPRRIEARQGQEARDVPVPRNLDFDAEQSVLYDRSFRALRLVYIGRAEGQSLEGLITNAGYDELNALCDFYRRELPQEGWVMEWEFGLSPRKMIFRKGSEECRVEVSRDALRGTIQAVIEIGPRATAS